MRPSLALAAMAAAAFAFAPPAAAATGSWASGVKAKVRLLAEGIGADGSLAAGIEIILPPGWKTYWRDPGTAGVAPRIDFSASRNFVDAEVAFPVPHRSDDGFSVTNVYEGRVVLPVNIAVADRTKPVELIASLDIGVCEVVCVPDHVEARVTAQPAEADAVAGKILAAARALVPGPPEAGSFAIDSISRTGGSDNKPVFRIRAIVPTGAKPEIFVEGPDDWSPYAPVSAGEENGRALYDLKFSRSGARTPIAGARFRITISAGGRAIEQTIGLD